MFFQKRGHKKITRILQKSIYIFVAFSLVLSYAYVPLGEIARRSDSPVLKQLAQFQPEIQKT